MVSKTLPGRSATVFLPSKILRSFTQWAPSAEEQEAAALYCWQLVLPTSASLFHLSKPSLSDTWINKWLHVSWKKKKTMLHCCEGKKKKQPFLARLNISNWFCLLSILRITHLSPLAGGRCKSLGSHQGATFVSIGKLCIFCGAVPFHLFLLLFFFY